MRLGPIIIIEDDEEDQAIYKHALDTMGVENNIRFFELCGTALDYLLTTSDQPFIILSDINMPLMNGFEFRERMLGDDYLKALGIPFIFISTSANAATVRQAHLLSVQGYFQKPNSIAEIRNMFTIIIEYWRMCTHVNDE